MLQIKNHPVVFYGNGWQELAYGGEEIILCKYKYGYISAIFASNVE